uniref:Uncharacterized protein n=1 Tax=Arundo donax TaxID=35708 RepID=A0A0A9FRU0_ARUDO
MTGTIVFEHYCFAFDSRCVVQSIWLAMYLV